MDAAGVEDCAGDRGGLGFGAEIARIFAREGAGWCSSTSTPRRRGGRGRDRGGRAGVAGDVTGATEVRPCRPSRGAHGGLDIVVNNAGWTHRNQPLLDVTRRSSTASTPST